MTSKLSGKVALVTGGSAGIGLGIAKCFAEEGARVFITGRRQAELDKAVTAIGSNATAVQGDTSNLSDLDRIYATIKDKAGHADVLAVNAGYYEFGSFGEITEEHFDKTFNTNVRGLLFAVQKALPLLPKGASVILTGSIASSIGIPSFSVYNATKWGVVAFSESLRQEALHSNVRVTVVEPGFVETELQGHNENPFVVDQIEKARESIGELLTAEDIARMIVYAVEQPPHVLIGEVLIRPTRES